MTPREFGSTMRARAKEGKLRMVRVKGKDYYAGFELISHEHDDDEDEESRKWLAEKIAEKEKNRK